MRTGEGVDRVSRGLQRGAQESDGRALSVGAGDPVEAQPIACGREHRQPVELCLDVGMRGTREIHQAAAFASGHR